MATGFGIALHDAGLPVGPDRCERLARAVTVMGATTVAELRACALATMVSDPAQMPTFDRVFAAVFGGPSPFGNQLPRVQPSFARPDPARGRSSDASSAGDPDGLTPGLQMMEAGPPSEEGD